MTVLGEISDSRAVETLIDASGMDAQEIRSKAIEALRSITGQQFGANHNRWGAWWSERATGDSGNVPGN